LFFASDCRVSAEIVNCASAVANPAARRIFGRTLDAGTDSDMM
jgi:hypothetical protein